MEAAVPIRGPLVRALLGIGLFCAGTLTVVGGLALRGPELVAVGVAGTLAACTAAGVARESPGPDSRRTFETAVQAAAWTVGALLLVAGIAVFAGGVVAVLAVGAGAVGVLVVRASKGRRRSSGAGPVGPPTGRGNRVPPATPPPAAGPATGRTDFPPGGARRLPPVWVLTTPALGKEWMRTTAALAGRLEPAARQSIVERRQEALDELERRDPAGFARWLAAGPTPGSDPAEHVRGPVHGGPGPDTGAA
jgi:hypothetical protein